MLHKWLSQTDAANVSGQEAALARRGHQISNLYIFKDVVHLPTTNLHKYVKYIFDLR